MLARLIQLLLLGAPARCAVACLVGLLVVAAESGADEIVHRAADIDVRPEDARDAEVYEPAPIEKQEVTREQVKAIPGNDISEAVATLPGFRTQQRVQGQKAAVSIEGMPAEYTLILVDGQRYTGQIGGVGDLRDVPVTNLDHIEVERGSQALRDGSEAGGGVVHVVTRRAPEQGIELHAEGGGGTDDRYVAMITGGARVGPVGATMSYTRDQIAGYDRRGSGAVFVGIGGSESTFVVDDYYARFEADVGDAGALRASLGWRVQDDDYVGQGDREGEQPGGQKTHRLLGGVGGRFDLGEFAAFDMDVFYYGDRVRDTVSRDVVLDESEIRVDPKTDFFFPIVATDHTVTVGLDLRFADLELETGSLEFDPAQGAEQLETLTHTTADTINAGIYVEWEAALASWLDLLAGVRAQLDTRFEPAWTPQVALLIRPQDSLRFRLQYGRSRRAPSLAQMYAPATSQNGGAYFLKGNEVLVPESAHSVRLGVEWQPESWAALSAAGFYNDIDDHIRALRVGSAQVGANPVCIGYACVGDPPPPFCSIPGTEDFPDCQPYLSVFGPVVADVLQYQNLQLARTAGVEVQGLIQPHALVDLRAGYTFMRTYVDFDARPTLDELPNEPRHTLNLVGQVRTPRFARVIGPPQLGLDVRYRSKALVETSGTGFAGFTSQERTDPSWVLDARLTLPFLEGNRAAVFFDVFNLTDEDVVDSYEIRGRSYFAGVRFALGSPPRNDP